MNKTTLQEIKDLATEIANMTNEWVIRTKIDKILALCEKQEVKGKVITNPIEQWGADKMKTLVAALKIRLNITSHIDTVALMSLLMDFNMASIAPKEKHLYVFSNGKSNWFNLTYDGEDAKKYRFCFIVPESINIRDYTELSQWQELADRGELLNAK